MTHVATITIDHTKVVADLTDFVFPVDLSHLPTPFWSVVANGGGDIRCYKSDGTTELARDVVSCDTGTETGELHIRYAGVMSSSTDTEIQIHADGSSSDYAVTDTYGRNACWQDAETAFLMESTTPVDRTGNHSLSLVGTVAVGDYVPPYGASIKFGSSSRLEGGGSSLYNLPLSFNFGISIVAKNHDGAMARCAAVWYGTDDLAVYPRDDAVLADAARVFWRDPVIYGGTSLKSPQNVSEMWIHTWFKSESVYAHRIRSDDGTEGATSTDGATSAGPFSGFAIGSYEGGAQQYNFDIAQVVVWTFPPSDAWIQTEYNSQHSPGTFYSAAAATGGTTSVSADAPLTWNIQEQVAQDQAVSWNITERVSADLATTWQVLQRAVADVPLAWQILTRVESDQQLAWDLLQQVVADRALAWDVWNRVTADLGVEWSVLERVEQDVALGWDIDSALTQVTSDLAIGWNVRQRVASDLALLWGLLERTGADLPVAWGVFERVAADQALAWNLVERVAADVPLTWDILSSLQRVSADLPLAWNLIGRVAASLDVRWDTLAQVGVSKDMRWAITQSVVSDLAARWDVRQRVQADTALRWDSLALTGNNVTLRWQLGDEALTPITIIPVPVERRVLPVPAEQRVFRVNHH